MVFIEAYGVNAHFRRLAERLAEAGFAAIVPNIYHGHVHPYSDQQHAIEHLKTLDDTQVMREAEATLDYLENDPHVSGLPAVLGFCMDGRYAFMANAEHNQRLRAVVAFYGGGIAPQQDRLGRKPLLDRVPEMKAPLLLQYGSADPSIAPDEHARIVETLGRANKRYSLDLYPGAGHGFFCDDRPSYDPDAVSQGWHRTLDFFAQYLGD